MKWRVLFSLSLAELLSLSLWFSATAVIPSLAVEWALDDTDKAWLTMSVQIGFVVGTFLSAFFNLPDILNARYLFAACAILGALFNGVIGVGVDDPQTTFFLRFFTGVCLAGVYPPGMKIMATWFKKGRGMAIGMLVGALTLGSASPHLFKVVGTPDWRDLMLIASACSVVAGLICLLFVKDGPHQVGGARFDWHFIGRAWSNPAVRLANFGYLGHQWELYAMWTWISLFLLASFQRMQMQSATVLAALATFSVIGIGGVGCVVAGLLADRYGRTTITIVSMVVSGCCCLVVGLFFGGPAWMLVTICLLWGFFIVADSAQFSASITELSEPAYVGTTLTLQTCVGFLLTMGSIRLLPECVEVVGWEWAFVVLAIGPAFGAWSMYRLRQLPEAAKIGGEGRTPY